MVGGRDRAERGGGLMLSVLNETRLEGHRIRMVRVGDVLHVLAGDTQRDRWWPALELENDWDPAVVDPIAETLEGDGDVLALFVAAFGVPWGDVTERSVVVLGDLVFKAPAWLPFELGFHSPEALRRLDEVVTGTKLDLVRALRLLAVYRHGAGESWS